MAKSSSNLVTTDNVLAKKYTKHLDLEKSRLWSQHIERPAYELENFWTAIYMNLSITSNNDNANIVYTALCSQNARLSLTIEQVAQLWRRDRVAHASLWDRSKELRFRLRYRETSTFIHKMAKSFFSSHNLENFKSCRHFIFRSLVISDNLIFY